MENKQSLYRLSKELRERGWKSAETADAIPHAETEKTITVKEETIMFDAKFGVPGAEEPSFLPPVVTLPGKAPCKQYLLMSTLKEQAFDETYETEKGLDRGTIFPQLDLPFRGEGGKKA